LPGPEDAQALVADPAPGALGIVATDESENLRAGRKVLCVADAIFGEPRLAGIYDPLDPDRSDLDAYLAVAEEFSAESVLDIGCGTGTLACLLAARGLEVIAVGLACTGGRSGDHDRERGPGLHHR